MSASRQISVRRWISVGQMKRGAFAPECGTLRGTQMADQPLRPYPDSVPFSRERLGFLPFRKPPFPSPKQPNRYAQTTEGSNGLRQSRKGHESAQTAAIFAAALRTRHAPDDAQGKARRSDDAGRPSTGMGRWPDSAGRLKRRIVPEHRRVPARLSLPYWPFECHRIGGAKAGVVVGVADGAAGGAGDDQIVREPIPAASRFVGHNSLPPSESLNMGAVLEPDFAITLQGFAEGLDLGGWDRLSLQLDREISSHRDFWGSSDRAGCSPSREDFGSRPKCGLPSNPVPRQSVSR